MSKTHYHHGDLKTAILDAAEETLDEKSLDAVSMRELARKAGVSPGAPYHHFGDRSGLIVALVQRGFSRLHESFVGKRDLRSRIDAYLDFAKENYALYQLMFSVEATEGDHAEALFPYASPLFEMLEESIAQMSKSKPSEDRSAAVSVWCFAHGLASLRAASPLQMRMGRVNLNDFAYETIRKLIE